LSRESRIDGAIVPTQKQTFPDWIRIASCSTSQGKEETAVTATLYRLPNADSAYDQKLNVSGIKLPELSLAKRFSRFRKVRLSLWVFCRPDRSFQAPCRCSIAEVERELIIQTLADQRGSRTSGKATRDSIRTSRNKTHECDGRGIEVPKPDAHW